jgi:hypothetical protein
MTTALTTSPTVPTTTTPRRATWALWGAAAGLGGVLTNMPFSQPIEERVRTSGDASAIVAELSRPLYHASAISGFLTVACLLFFAAGLARWGRQQASESLALRVAPAAITASAGALIAAYGVKGMLAAYLPGGFNESSYGDAARYTYFLLDDLGGYYGWWGVTVAIACLSHLALRERLVARWIGAVGVLFVALPLAFLLGVGFTGFSGIAAPIFLVIAGIGLSRQRG